MTELSPLPVVGERLGEGSSNSESSEHVHSADDDDALPMPGRVWEDSGPSLKELLAQQARKTIAKPVESSNVESVDGNNFTQVMTQLRDAVHKRTTTIDGFLVDGRIVSLEDDTATLSVNEMAAKMLERNGKKQIIQDALSEIMSRSMGVKFAIESEAPAAAEPAAAPMVPQRAKPVAAPVREMPAAPNTPVIRITDELRAELREKDERIRYLVDELKAEIVRVEPVDS